MIYVQIYGCRHLTGCRWPILSTLALLSLEKKATVGVALMLCKCALEFAYFWDYELISKADLIFGICLKQGTTNSTGHIIAGGYFFPNDDSLALPCMIGNCFFFYKTRKEWMNEWVSELFWYNRSGVGLWENPFVITFKSVVMKAFLKHLLWVTVTSIKVCVPNFEFWNLNEKSDQIKKFKSWWK